MVGNVQFAPENDRFNYIKKIWKIVDVFYDIRLTLQPSFLCGFFQIWCRIFVVNFISAKPSNTLMQYGIKCKRLDH
jgi:hypothetical protein